MKLKNKKTGEIGDLIISIDGEYYVLALNIYKYDNPIELAKEWEEYEEPKGCWMINILGIVEYTHGLPENEVEMMKIIGNYFETKEEAEKAVERLRAWKRLKDKGFEFKKWESYEETSGLSFPDRYIVNSYTAIFDFNRHCRKHEIENEVKDDLDLLFFGGEE